MRTRRHNLQEIGLAAALALGLPAAPVGAQSAALPDPTRPPPGFVDELPAAAGAAGAPTTGAPRAAAADDPAGRGLQSVLIPRQGRPVAIIDGRYVPLGERHGDWELVAVAESEVVLARGRLRKVMKLTPGAEKKPPAAAAAKTRRGGADSRPEALRASEHRATPSARESETGR